MTFAYSTTMKTYKNIFQKLCSIENIKLAFSKAKKGKSKKPDVIEFCKNAKENLENLRLSLLWNFYYPKPLETFVIRDPKTRKIRKSWFVDRIVHHAIVNILEPIFERLFIYDSYANRLGKGNLAAIKRFDSFKLKVSKNNTQTAYVLKADIKHYFEEVNHQVLLTILGNKIKDKQIMNLISKVLNNHSIDKGMPLGNMTSQFFANVYLNELDQFVKHQLKIKYYIRYVDDFVILSHNKQYLHYCREQISTFLKEKLELELHPSKTKIIAYQKGINFLGVRIFPYHKLLRKVSIRGIRNKIYNLDFNSLCISLQGWLEYASHSNTFKLIKRIITEIEDRFKDSISGLRINQLIKECGF